MAVPFTGRDLIALEALKARCHRESGTPAEDLVRWAFEIADAFVAGSTSRWAMQERGDPGGPDRAGFS